MAVDFKIERSFGVISEKKSGWKKELNYVSWAGKDPKFDIREWDPDHEKMGKGVTLSGDELSTLYGLLGEFFAEKNNSSSGGGKTSVSVEDIIDLAKGEIE